MGRGQAEHVLVYISVERQPISGQAAIEGQIVPSRHWSQRAPRVGRAAVGSEDRDQREAD